MGCVDFIGLRVMVRVFEVSLVEVLGFGRWGCGGWVSRGRTYCVMLASL